MILYSSGEAFENSILRLADLRNAHIKVDLGPRSLVVAAKVLTTISIQKRHSTTSFDGAV